MAARLPARDLAKLGVINSLVKMFVYPKKDLRITKAWLRTVLERCCGPDPTNGESVKWLFVGLTPSVER